MTKETRLKLAILSLTIDFYENARLAGLDGTRADLIVKNNVESVEKLLNVLMDMMVTDDD